MSRNFHAYPLTFSPIIKHPVWGGDKLYQLKNLPHSGLPAGESWEISTVPGNLSIVNNGKYKDSTLPQLITLFGEKIVGKNVFERYGEHFPLLIKIIDTQEDLSIQVHPDDKMAQLRHGTNGKEEMWYIMQAEHNSRLLIGFNENVDKDIYLQHLKNNSLPNILHSQQVQTGDIYHIPPGRVHAIGRGILLAEIQQTSDITYRLYDWGRGRQLHTEEALDTIDFNTPGSYKTSCLPAPGEMLTAVDSEHFTSSVIQIHHTHTLYNDGASFHILINVSETTVSIHTKDYTLDLPYSGTVLIPASIKEYRISCPLDNAKLLHTCIS